MKLSRRQATIGGATLLAGITSWFMEKTTDGGSPCLVFVKGQSVHESGSTHSGPENRAHKALRCHDAIWHRPSEAES